MIQNIREEKRYEEKIPLDHCHPADRHGQSRCGGNAGEKITVLIYLSASDLESRYGYGSAEILEIENSGFDADQINVLILAGGSKQWSIFQMSETEAILMQVGSNRTRILDRFDQGNMGEPSTLSHFLNDTADKFPAKKICAVFHGLWYGTRHGNLS